MSPFDVSRMALSEIYKVVETRIVLANHRYFRIEVVECEKPVREYPYSVDFYEEEKHIDDKQSSFYTTSSWKRMLHAKDIATEDPELALGSVLHWLDLTYVSGTITS